MSSAAMSAAASETAVVLGELQLMITAMRRNRKWKTGPLDFQHERRQHPPLSLVYDLDRLRWRLHTDQQQRDAQLDPYLLVKPFLAIVSSAETSGHLTALALSALHRFLSLPSLFPAAHPSSPQAIHAIVLSLAHCRYESTDTSKDELVLLQLLSLVLVLLCTPSSSVHLTSELCWSMMKTVYRIYRYMRPPDYTELLCHQAEQTIIQMVRLVYREQQRFEAVCVTIFEFICTLAEISHADVGFAYSLSQGLPVPPYLNTPSSAPNASATTTTAAAAAATNHSPDLGSVNAYFPSRRILLSSADLLDLGLLTLPPPPLSLPANQFASPTHLSKAVSDWSRRTIFTTQLLLSVFESAPPASASLLGLIEDSVCKFLLRNCRSQHAMLYAITLRCFFLLMALYRQHLHMQMEVMFNTVYLRALVSKSTAQPASHDPSSTSYDIKELTLESLLDFCRLPWFWTELYVNYDCHPTSSNLHENLFRSLCKSVFPVQGLVTGNHVLALKCLLEGLRHMSQQQHRGLIGAAVAAAESTDAAVSPFLYLLSDLRATRLYKRLLQSCVDEFNKKPRRGIAAMTATLNLFPSFDHLKSLTRKEDVASITPAQHGELQSLARFLRSTPGLDKVVIGQFIAEPGPVSAVLLKEYLALFDFHGQSLDDALRMFIEAFRLPVEAQQIDRVLQAFANQYFLHNPGLLANADVVHTLAFSLIMLNTDAHNDQIKQKMTVDQFVSNNRGINAGENVPRQLLEGLYYTIKRKEIRMSGDGLTGEVNDALWSDLLMMSNRVMELRPYIRMDRIHEHAASYVQHADPSTPPQRINGHVIGLTVFRPPIALPVPSPAAGNGHLPELPVTPSRQVTLSELQRAQSEGHSQAAGPSIFTVTDPQAAVARGSWMEEDMFSEGWNAAIAALSMVFDLIHIDREGRGVVVGSVDIGDEDDGWNKVEKDRTADIKPPSDDPSASSPEEADDGDLLSYLHQGFLMLSSVAATYTKHHVLDKLISALCKFTGLVTDYRGDSKASPQSSNSYSAPARSPTHAHRGALSSALMRFSSQPKAQWSLTLMFSLVHTHYDVIREGWRDVLTCILQVYAMGLLPPSMLLLDDHVGWLELDGDRRKGRSRLLTHLAPPSVSEERSSAVSALFSSVSSYFMYGMTGTTSASAADDREGKGAEVEAAERLCRECIEQCAIPALLLDSKIMHVDSLVHLISALMDLIPVQRVNGLVGVKAPRRWLGLASGTGEPRVCAGKEEGEGYDLSITDEDADMVSDLVYHHDDGKAGDQFPSAHPCAACECHSLSSTDTPVEVRRLLFCQQLLSELIIHNRDRMDGVWPSVCSYLLSLIASTPLAGPEPLPFIGRSNSIPSLTSIREAGNDHDGRSSTPSPAPLHSPPPRHTPLTPVPASSHAHSQSASSAPAVLSPFVVESAVSCFFSVSSRLMFKDSLASDILSSISALATVSLVHAGPATQLMAGLLSLLRTHSSHLQPQHTPPILSLVESAALYRPTFMLGYHCLTHLLIAQRCAHVTLNTFSPTVQAVLAYSQSRWCSPTIGLALCEALMQLYERSKAIVTAEREHQHGNGDAFATPVKHITRNQTASPSSATSAAVPPSPSSSPLRRFHALWQQLCSPLLAAHRTIITSATTRIRLLHNAHLRASRSGGPGTRAAHAATPTPAIATSSAPYKGYIGYVQGFSEVRRKAINQLRQILILEDFSVRISDCAAHAAVHAEPQLSPAQSAHPKAARQSPAQSLTSTTFWQLCLDEIIFPSLLSLSLTHAIDLELTDDLTTARSACLVMLEKVFLLHLPQLLTLEGAGGGRGFNGAWLHVLKLMDGFTQLGLRRERLMMERKKRSVYDRKRERRKSELEGSTPPTSSDDFDGVDSGVLLTESVEEALKNCILVMKAFNVFAVTAEGGGRGGARPSIANQELWELTWAVVDPVFPHLKLQLFPELAKIIPAPPVATPPLHPDPATSAVAEEPSLSHAQEVLSPEPVSREESEEDAEARSVARTLVGQLIDSVVEADGSAASALPTTRDSGEAAAPQPSSVVPVSSA